MFFDQKTPVYLDTKKSRKADGGGINPYGQPDRKIAVFTTSLQQSQSQIHKILQPLLHHTIITHTEVIAD